MQKGRKRLWTVVAITSAALLVCVYFLYIRTWPINWLQRLEYKSEDSQVRHGRSTEKSPEVVLVGIDQTSILTNDFGSEDIAASPALRSMQTSFPWSRSIWAEVVAKLAEAGAKVVTLDLVFGPQGVGDDQLRQVLDKYKSQVVIGCNFDAETGDRGQRFTLTLPNQSVMEYEPGKSPLLDDRLGFVTVWPDDDLVLRRARFRLDNSVMLVLPDGVEMLSLAGRTVAKAGHPELVPKTTDNLLFRYSGQAGSAYKIHSLANVLAKSYWEKTYQNGKFFKDKIVFIGPTAEILHDSHPTPFTRKISDSRNLLSYTGDMSGPEIQVAIINAALHREFIRDATIFGGNALWEMLFLLFFSLLAVALPFLIIQPLKRLAALLGFAILYWFLGLMSYSYAALVIPTAAPIILLLFSGFVILVYDFFLERRERARVRRTLEQYVSRDVVRELLDNPQTYFDKLGGVRRPVTALFSDVRNFTTMTEGADASQLVAQLNEYFEEMVNQVFTFKGTLDKFIGDGLMAVWGNILSQGPEKDSENAVATALAMKSSLARLNISWEQRGMPRLAIGIGVNHGDAIVGNLGSNEKKDFTAVGDAINLASRLEGLTKKYKLDLLVGETVAPLISKRFVLRTVDYVRVSGKTKPVNVYAVIGERSAAVKPELQAWLDRYEEAVKLYRKREFAEAGTKFEQCLKEKPDDYLCSRYFRSCHTLFNDPPDESWEGVSVMTEK